MNERREWLRTGFGLSLAAAGLGAGLSAYAKDDEVVTALKRGGVVAAFRHADAPGTFDPPGFRLGDCSTQRNLGERGRAQAQGIGAWFRQRGLKPTRVRSSPWCRCLDTASLAFGQAEAWDALASTIRSDDGKTNAQVDAMRLALRALPSTGFEVWVSHQVTLGALIGESTSSGEALLIRAAPDGAVQLIARFTPA